MSLSKHRKGQPEDIFVPSRDIESPPLTSSQPETQPFKQAHHVLSLFKSREAGRQVHEVDWTVYQFVPGEYEELLRLIGEDESLAEFVKHKLSYDWDGNRRQLAFRMHGLVHENFRVAVQSRIGNQLEALGRGTGEAAEFARRVRYAGSTTMCVPVRDAPSATKSHHDPDSTFKYKGDSYPAVVIEIAHSTNKKKLPRLADDYFSGSKGNTQVVIGINIEYDKKKSRSANLSIWRLHRHGNHGSVIAEVDGLLFRDKDGNAVNEDSVLRLHLKDFASEKIVSSKLGADAQATAITISCRQLFDILQDAEEDLSLTEDAQLEDSKSPILVIRDRTQSPEDQITPEEERRILEQESRIERRLDDDDLDHESSPTS